MMRAIVNTVQSAWLLILPLLDPEFGGEFFQGSMGGKEWAVPVKESVSCWVRKLQSKTGPRPHDKAKGYAWRCFNGHEGVSC